MVLLEAETIKNCLFKLCLIEFELNFFFSEARDIESIEELVKRCFAPIIEKFEMYQEMIKLFISGIVSIQITA